MRKQKSFCNEQKENIKEKTNDENAKIKKIKTKAILQEEFQKKRQEGENKITLRNNGKKFPKIVGKENL